ncbi:polyprotein [Cucumis melo var. makuwa]|uniref:Polyprotein n=1 Tax=Cucumis melo var. makuwa TaxID=1194695 RepID=A0A5D3CK06_CUCMM|nr:polyprotein [Cucumis melo var. makuwa]
MESHCPQGHHISRDVIFMEDKKQEADDNTVNESSETAIVHMEKSIDGSFEAEPVHEIQEPFEQQVLEIHRSGRTTRPPGWQSEYIMESNIAYYYLLTEDGEPLTLQEALTIFDAAQWIKLMQEEIESLHKNKTWDLITLPQRRKPIGNKWMYKIKGNNDGQVEQYRTRLVVKGYAKKEDVKIAFLHEDLEEEIYMLQPKSFEISSDMSHNSEAKRMEMSRVPYASTVESLMLAMICTRLDIAHAGALKLQGIQLSMPRPNIFKSGTTSFVKKWRNE